MPRVRITNIKISKMITGMPNECSSLNLRMVHKISKCSSIIKLQKQQ